MTAGAPAPGDRGRLGGLTCADADWAGLRVVVAGIGVSGFAAADALVERGAQVVVLDAADGPPQRERAMILETLGAQVRLGPEALTALPPVGGVAPDVVVTSPGWRPDHPVLAGAATAGVPVWSEVELAWRMRAADGRGAVAHGDRHQRQDDDHDHARRHARRRRVPLGPRR